MINLTEFEKINIPNNAISGFEFFDGNQVLLSTPHAVSQTRGKKQKFAEAESFKLASLVKDATGCSLITKTENLNDDANSDFNSNYRNKIAAQINLGKVKYIFDIHSLTDKRPEQINLGTNHGFNLVGNMVLFDRIKEIFKQNGFLTTTDFPFAAGQNTIAGFFSKQYHIFCLQIEVNSAIYRDEQSLNNLINALTQIVKTTMALSKIKNS